MNDEPIESNVIDLRRPDVPATLNEIAALRGEALEVMEARIQLLETARKAAIRATHPEDWVLYKDKKGRVVGYLEDAGADRVRDLFGIEIYNISPFEKITEADRSFVYIISGDGRSKLTTQIVEKMEGGRSSREDFCKDKVGAQLDLAVRKAARANLDGGITRELAGLKSVPLEELSAAWQGTTKAVKNCREGRGFGSQDERRGAAVQQSDVEAPTCTLCQSKMEFRAAGTRKRDNKPYPAFWSCSNFEKHRTEGEEMSAYSIGDEDWRKMVAARKEQAS